MKKTITILVIIIAAVLITGCPGVGPDSATEPAVTVNVTGISLNKSTMGIFVGSPEQLTATISPADATNQIVTWTSSNESAATVSASGLVTAIAAGTAVITVTTSDGGLNDTCGATSTTHTFVSVTNPGDMVPVTAGSISFNMIYVNASTGTVIPIGGVDGAIATVDTKFFMAETEVTNALMVEVLQWAYDNSKFSTTVGDSNGLDASTAKHGTRQLLDLDDVYIRINYSSGCFTSDSGYDEHPATNISWYGAVMFCNWLTEMRDGNTDNLVYAWVDNGDGNGVSGDGEWQDDETDETVSNTGFRLPGSYEWELASRYRDDAVNTVAGYSSPWFTKGDSASDATANWSSTTETGAVGWHIGNSDDATHAVKRKRDNSLGIYDMSGNVFEWCFTKINVNYRVGRGGSWGNYDYNLRVGNEFELLPHLDDKLKGFRFVRTQ